MTDTNTPFENGRFDSSPDRAATDTRKPWAKPVITEVLDANSVEGGARVRTMETVYLGNSYRPS